MRRLWLVIGCALLVVLALVASPRGPSEEEVVRRLVPELSFVAHQTGGPSEYWIVAGRVEKRKIAQRLAAAFKARPGWSLFGNFGNDISWTFDPIRAQSLLRRLLPWRGAQRRVFVTAYLGKATLSDDYSSPEGAWTTVVVEAANGIGPDATFGGLPKGWSITLTPERVPARAKRAP